MEALFRTGTSICMTVGLFIFFALPVFALEYGVSTGVESFRDHQTASEIKGNYARNSNSRGIFLGIGVLGAGGGYDLFFDGDAYEHRSFSVEAYGCPYLCNTDLLPSANIQATYRRGIEEFYVKFGLGVGMYQNPVFIQTVRLGFEPTKPSLKPFAELGMLTNIGGNHEFLPIVQLGLRYAR